MENRDLYDDWEDEVPVDDICPNCGEEYDEIDWEYQRCHLCGFNNNPHKSIPHDHQ